MVGSGGNVILIPVLDFILFRAGLRDEVLVKSIIAHSLVVTLFLGIIVSYRQYRERNFFPMEVIITSSLGMITATLTTWAITTGDWYRKSDFDVVFAFMLALLILKMVVDRKSGLSGANERKSRGLMAGIGSITGVVTSLSGLGGGIILIPGFTDLMRTSLKKASSVSISVISALALPISISYLINSPEDNHSLPLQTGYISFGLVTAVLAGVLISAPFRSKGCSSHPSPRDSPGVCHCGYQPAGKNALHHG